MRNRSGLKHFILILLMIILLFMFVSACGKGTPPQKEDETREKDAGAVKPAGPSVLWELRIGRKVPEKISWDGQEVYVADSIGNILAVAVDDGAQRIAVHVPGPIMGWDMQGRGIASSSIDKKVHLNDSWTGMEGLSIPCESTPSEPVFTSKGVIFSEGLGPYRVKHVSRENGSILWSREFKAKPSGYAPAFGFREMYIAFDDGYIRALSTADGRTLWEYQVGEPLEIKPGGRWKGEFSFLGEAGESRMRLQPIQIGGIGRIIVDPYNGVLVPSEDGYVRCFNWQDGTLLWERKFDDRVWRIWTIIRPGETWVFAETVEGEFARINPKTGEIIAAISLIDPTFGCIFIDNSMIVDTTGENGETVIRSLVDLTEIHRIDLHLIPIDGVKFFDILIVRTDDGRIVCMRMAQE